MRLRRLAPAALAALLAAAAGAGADAAPAGRLLERECWLEPGPRPEAELRCAVLEVPERWDAPLDGSAPARRVRIPVVVLDGAGVEDDAILVPGGGGPGASVGLESDTARHTVAELQGLAWRTGRDVVVVDQRGAGLADPALHCPESLAVMGRVIGEDLPREEEAALWAGAARACRERLRAAGVHLEAYETRQAARDLEALRLALGYARWNLWGTSYGARLALEYARAFPDGVRTLVLDSPDVPDADPAAGPAHFERVLRELFDRCSGTPRCRRDAPDPAGALDRLLARLAKQPLRLEVASPADLRPVAVLLTPRALLEVLFHALYDTGTAHTLPLVLTAADRGSDDLLLGLVRDWAWAMLDARFADGLFDVIPCRETVPFADLERLEREARAHPWRQGFRGFRTLARQVCAAWDVGRAPAEARRPVAWPGPALVLAGRLDPVIPLSDARRAAEALPAGRLLEFPGVGHGVEYTLWSCVDELTEAFVEAPAEPLDEAAVAACRAEGAATEFWTLAPPERLPPTGGPADGPGQAATPSGN